MKNNDHAPDLRIVTDDPTHQKSSNLLVAILDLLERSFPTMMAEVFVVVLSAISGLGAWPVHVRTVGPAPYHRRLGQLLKKLLDPRALLVDVGNLLEILKAHPNSSPCVTILNFECGSSFPEEIEDVFAQEEPLVIFLVSKEETESVREIRHQGSLIALQADSLDRSKFVDRSLKVELRDRPEAIRNDAASFTKKLKQGIDSRWSEVQPLIATIRDALHTIPWGISVELGPEFDWVSRIDRRHLLFRVQTIIRLAIVLAMLRRFSGGDQSTQDAGPRTHNILKLETADVAFIREVFRLAQIREDAPYLTPKQAECLKALQRFVANRPDTKKHAVDRTLLSSVERPRSFTKNDLMQCLPFRSRSQATLSDNLKALESKGFALRDGFVGHSELWELTELGLSYQAATFVERMPPELQVPTQPAVELPAKSLRDLVETYVNPPPNDPHELRAASGNFVTSDPKLAQEQAGDSSSKTGTSELR